MLYEIVRHDFDLSRAIAILNVDNTIKWWAVFHCGSTPLGYGLLSKAICAFENRAIKFDMRERGGGGWVCGETVHFCMTTSQN